MKKLATLVHDSTTHGVATLCRYLGGPLVTIAGVILFTIAVVQGESWALQNAPPLALSPSAGCLPDDSPDAGVLPLAILH